MTRHSFTRQSALIAFLFATLSLMPAVPAMADEAPSPAVPGNGSMQSSDSGVGINGNANGSTVNNNQNNLATGNNTNVNLLTPTLISPNQAAANGGVGGSGGNSVLMLPRNPLSLGNAAAGRSNFGLQFGLQNNPILGGLAPAGGGQNALGWFMQAGLTIPFGKIPEIFRAAQNSPLDALREEGMARQRNVLGNMTAPPSANPGPTVEKKVNARISGISAYNYSTLPTGKITLPGPANIGEVDDTRMSQPRLLALSSASVFTRPLNTGEKIGEVQAGSEYPYLGHTRSGWVKVLLQNGQTGWASTHFEYIKQDYTEIDDLALAPLIDAKEKATLTGHKAALLKGGFAKHGS